MALFHTFYIFLERLAPPPLQPVDPVLQGWLPIWILQRVPVAMSPRSKT